MMIIIKLFSLKTNHGTYIRSSNRKNGRMNQQTFIGSWERFKFTKGQKRSLRNK